MGEWFERFFHQLTTEQPLPHHFGRNINAQINPGEQQLFTQALEAFREGRIIEGYEHYLRSLENFSGRDSNNNIIVEVNEDVLHFELCQGCAIVHGRVTDKIFEAYAVITTDALTDVAVKRHLLERNDVLTYVRYYTHNGKVLLKLYLDNTTMTPQKIFYPLRELALNADYEKEYLRYHYKQPSLTEVEHLEPIDDEELRIKYATMQEWISNCQRDIKELPANDNNTTVSFSALTLLFQIDYLLLPQKDMAQEIIEKVTSFFQEDERLVEQKNDELLNFIAKLQKLDLESFSNHFYKARYTFTPMERATIEELNQFVSASLEKVSWFKQQRYSYVVSTIYRYMALYMLYNFGVHPSYRALLHLLVEINSSHFFEALGYEPLYDEREHTFRKSTIVSRITDAIEPYQNEFTHLKSFGKELNYTTLEEFSHSFYLHLKNLDYSER